MHLFALLIYQQLILQVMPENFFRGRRPPFPLWNKRINMVVGEPIEFNLPEMRKMAISASHELASAATIGWPSSSPHGLDKAAQRCLYVAISGHIQAAMESLRSFSKVVLQPKSWNWCLLEKLDILHNNLRSQGNSIFLQQYLCWSLEEVHQVISVKNFVLGNSLVGYLPSTILA